MLVWNILQQCNVWFFCHNYAWKKGCLFWHAYLHFRSVDLVLLVTEYLCNSFPISQPSQLSIIFVGSPCSSSSLAATLVRRHPERKIAQQQSDSCLCLCPGICHAAQNHSETFSIDMTNCKLLSSFLYANPAKSFTAFGSPPPIGWLNFGLFPPSTY